MTEAIREELHELADEAYREFNRSLVPGEILPMIGVRMPVLRAFAKRLSRESFYSYLETARILRRTSAAGTDHWICTDE